MSDRTMAFWYRVLYGWWVVWLFLAGCAASCLLALTDASDLAIVTPLLAGLAVWIVLTLVARVELRRFSTWYAEREARW